MKNLILAAAVTLAATSAFASKARVAALSDRAGLVDTQTIFKNPGYLGMLGDYATFEFGNASSYDYKATTTPADTTGAEGGFIRSSGDAKWGFYLGHKSDTIVRTRAAGAAAGVTTLPEQNPLELFYAMKGDLNWGASLFYSNSDKKTTQQKQNSAGVRFGAATTQWDAYINLGLGATAKNDSANAEVKNDLGAKIGGGYYFDTLYVYADYGMQNAKITVAGNEAAKLEGQEMNIGVLDTKKQDGADFFYGISYGNYKLKNKVTGGSSLDNNYLPVIVGIEADAASWLTLRASLQQNVLFGGHKYDAGTGTAADTDTWNNSTVVAAGLGAKWNKFIVDGTLKAAGASNGSIDFGSNFLGQGSITYMF